MRSGTIVVQFLLLFFIYETYGQKNRGCQVFKLCDLLAEPKRVSKHQLEHIRDRIEITKTNVVSSHLRIALRAEREKSKWRQKADRYCEAPVHKINKVLGCDDLQINQDNYSFYTELKKFCRKLIRKAERGAENAELIETISECEKKVHSRDVYKRFQSLSLNLQQRCRLESKRQAAIKRARKYEEQAKQLRLQAKKFRTLIENSLKVDEDDTVYLTLSQEQVQQIVQALEQQNDNNEVEEDDESEINDASEDVLESTKRVEDNVNDLVEVISHQIRNSGNQRSSERGHRNRCKKPRGSADKCNDKFTVELTRTDISRILQFLDREEEEGEVEISQKVRGTAQKQRVISHSIDLEQLKEQIEEEFRTKTNSEESSEEIVEACGNVVRKSHKPASNCGQKVNLELAEYDVTRLVEVLEERSATRRPKKQRQVRTTVRTTTPEPTEPEPESEETEPPPPPPTPPVTKPPCDTCGNYRPIQVQAHASVNIN